jgi:4-oxalocrotonate tautomerase
MPIIRVEILEGRSPEKKERLIAALTEVAVNTLDVNPEQVRVVIYEMPKPHWGIAGKSVARREAEAKHES